MRLPGGSSAASPVISGVSQGTVLGPLLFLILMSDIDVLNAKVSDSDLIFRRTLQGYYAEGMHANF